MLKNKLIMMLALVAIAGCTSTQQARVDFDRNSEITTSHYKTFAWLNETKVLAESIDANPVMKVRIDNAIEQAFIAKGYALVSDAEAADFTISYTMGSRDKVKVDTLPLMYRTNFLWGHRYYGGIGLSSDTRVRNYTEGKLAIDVYDVKSHQPVWHGWAIKRIKTSEQDNPSKAIKMVVEQVVAQF
ncbi:MULTISPECIES: DUF4136 domain-containing protein [unclassified Colwellia]|jgi:hypothetical protein|uniref:DUF4136 domain-containing protein n=1 Tax=unclassified Colwellia TaxID=196834 RepID=UPI000D3BBD7E|nr:MULTISPECIES: DUF4136 domain-containing protein [unclassified Colwellia]AWB58059.1 DUF4136 domain-containing protein [Colwellia sp. Arc7-D]MBA6416632.1 DUF4136 domain-containing protein [Colwellia sp. 6M3]|tara:strand:- start:29 stop:586 length:558 start_codon:yes stop_codon:yes gene_type:complete